MNGITGDNASRKLETTSVKVKDQTPSDSNMVSASALGNWSDWIQVYTYAILFVRHIYLAD